MQYPGWPADAGLAVLVAVETIEAAADDFLRMVALDSFGSGVPAGDIALGIEHVQGIVGHAIDQQAELLLAAPQGQLRLMLFGAVTGDLGKAQQLAFAAADGVDHDVGPERTAIAVQAPTFALVTADPRRFAQCPLGQAGLAISGRIEPREMLAEDFIGGVALQPLSTGAPATDPTIGVEHIDGIVGYRLDQ